MRGMSYVLAAYDACGRFLLAVRQSAPSGTNHRGVYRAGRFETVGNRLNPSHGQNSLCRFAAEAQIQDRSRAKTGLNTAPGFSRVYNIPSPSMGEGQGEGDTADPPPTVIPAEAGTQRKTKHAIYPPSRSPKDRRQGAAR